MQRKFAVVKSAIDHEVIMRRSFIEGREWFYPKRKLKVKDGATQIGVVKNFVAKNANTYWCVMDDKDFRQIQYDKEGRPLVEIRGVEYVEPAVRNDNVIDFNAYRQNQALG